MGYRQNVPQYGALSSATLSWSAPFLPATERMLRPVEAVLGSGDAPQPAIADPAHVAGLIASAEVAVNMTVAVGNGADTHPIHCRRLDRGCLDAAILTTAGTCGDLVDGEQRRSNSLPNLALPGDGPVAGGITLTEPAGLISCITVLAGEGSDAIW
jgi:hypothetical protein